MYCSTATVFTLFLYSVAILAASGTINGEIDSEEDKSLVASFINFAEKLSTQ